MKSSRFGRRATGLVGAVLLLASVTSACGSDADDGRDAAGRQPSNVASGSASGPVDSPAGTGSAGSSGSAELEAARELVDGLDDGPGRVDFPGPDAPVDPGSHYVAIVAAGMAGAGAKAVVPKVAKAVKAIGWTTDAPYDGQFDPTVQSGLIQQAIQRDYDGIFLVAITPSTVAAAVNAATAADLPVVCVNCGPDPDAGAAQEVIHADPSSIGAGQAQAALAMTLTEGTGNIFVFSDDAYGQTIEQVAASSAYLKDNCGSCKVETVKMSIDDAIAPGVPMFTAFMSAHPKGTVDIVIAPYDTAAAPFSQAAQQAGRTEITFISFGGLLPFYRQIAAGSPPGSHATMAAPIPYESWSGVDLMARSLAGQDGWDATNIPIQIVTTENASEFDAEAPYAEPKGDFRADFKELWGVG